MTGVQNGRQAISHLKKQEFSIFRLLNLILFVQPNNPWPEVYFIYPYLRLS